MSLPRGQRCGTYIGIHFIENCYFHFHFHFRFSEIFYQCVRIEHQKYVGLFELFRKSVPCFLISAWCPPIGYSQAAKPPSGLQLHPSNTSENHRKTKCCDLQSGQTYGDDISEHKDFERQYNGGLLGDNLSMGFLSDIYLAVNLNLNYKKSRNFALVIVCDCLWVNLHVISKSPLMSSSGLCTVCITEMLWISGSQLV